MLLVAAAGLTGWMAVRASALEMLSGQVGQVGVLATGRPDAVLDIAIARFAAARARLDPRLLPSIRAAAAQVPLDGRPYMLIGSDYLRSGRTDLAVATLEAGRRLNPRQRWVHLLLLEHYLRTGQYRIAADEFAVLSRLVNEAQAPIATALAKMSVAPQTRDAVRLTLDQDPGLEQSVLTSMANSDVEPSAIFRMASPAALAMANLPNGWGAALVDRLVTKHRYRQAHAVWQRLNGIGDQQGGALLYNAGLRSSAGKPPFAWKTASDNIAAVDVRDGKFNVDYYGRDSGDLASQLLLLPPGGYRFGFTASGIQQGAASTLEWSVTCDAGAGQPLARMTIPPEPSPRQFVIRFAVPPNCPAQWLRLSGAAGEFPTPVSAVIEHLQLEKAAR